MVSPGLNSSQSPQGLCTERLADPAVMSWRRANPELSELFHRFRALVVRSEYIHETRRFLDRMEGKEPTSLTTTQERALEHTKRDWIALDRFFEHDWPKIEKTERKIRSLYPNPSPLDDIKAACFALDKHQTEINAAHGHLERVLSALGALGLPLEHGTTRLQSLIAMRGTGKGLDPEVFKKIYRFIESRSYPQAA